MNFKFRNLILAGLALGFLVQSAAAVDIWVGGVRRSFNSIAALYSEDIVVRDGTRGGGNLRVGDGTPGVTLNGEDAYIEGTLEVDGAVQLDGAVTFGSTVTRTGQVYTFTNMKVAGASGTDWVITDNDQKATLAASQTSETLIVQISGLKVGSVITKLNLLGQVESAGGAVVLDADLRRVTAVAADLTDASVATIVRPTVAADVKLGSTATKGVSAAFTETVTADTTYYVRVTGTTAASTDIALQGIQLTVTEK